MIKGINHLTLSVNNINESFDFYRNVLRFTPVMQSSFSAYFRAGDLWLALKQEPDAARRDNLYSHAALDISADDFPEMVKQIKDSGAAVWQDNSSEGDSFYFTDPSGNKLEIHCSDLETRIKHGKKNWDNDVKWFEEEIK